MLVLLTLAMGVATLPKPGELRSFEDWSVGCDNGRSCTAVSLMDVETNENQLTLQIVRSGAPNAPAQLRIPNIEQRSPNMRVALVRNDATVLAQATLPPEGQALTVSLDAALVNGLSKGRFVLYHGNLGVGENNKAALFLVHEVFPMLSVPCVIAGNHPSRQLQ
ncbi:MAG: DUF1176 domain-containing protein, partial [Sphingomonadaceae bacterium]|nr:DUF1176 domain-containing protein [Sphingomonadaceae bacterium]